MFILILSLLVGISFFPLLFADFEKFQLWHAQGIWTQALIMMAFSWSFFENPKNLNRKNVPLGLLHLWVGGSTVYICTRSQIVGVYNYWTLFPYFNFLCLIILYKLITMYLTKDNVRIILEWLRYVVIATLIVSVLQYLGLSQFFDLLTKEYTGTNYNIVSGFIGNGTHLSGFLAMCIPLFLWKKTEEDFLAIVLLFLVLCLSGTSIGEPAISGFIIAAVLMAYMSKKRWVWATVLIVMGIVAVAMIYNLKPILLRSNGRMGLWEPYLPLIRNNFILGHGLGTVKLLSTKPEFPNAHHLHLEYYQYLVELGFVGLILIGNLILEFFKKKTQTSMDKVLKAIVYGFLLSCLFNFPSHLWLPSVFAIFAYSAFLIKEKNHDIFTQGT